MKFLIFLFVLSLTGCSSIKRQQIYSGFAGMVIGGTIGSIMGKSMSPTRRDERYNQLLGTSIGTLVGAMAGVGLGTLFWNDNPENQPLNNMILKDAPKNVGSKKEKIKIVRPKKIERIPLKSEVPVWLKGKVKELYRIGDCVAPSRVEQAIYDGAKLARTI